MVEMFSVGMSGKQKFMQELRVEDVSNVSKFQDLKGNNIR
jgi:hypothetical protein